MVAGRQYIRPILCGALDIICLATKTRFHVSTSRCGIGRSSISKSLLLEYLSKCSTKISMKNREESVLSLFRRYKKCVAQPN